MADLEGFYNEEVLDQLLYDGTISRLEYIYHHSPEMIGEYKKFCQENKLPEDEDSANKFQDWLLKAEENAHTDNLD